MKVNVKILDGCASILENDPLFLLWSSINKIHEHVEANAMYYYCCNLCHHNFLYKQLNVEYDIYNQNYVITAQTKGIINNLESSITL